MRFFARTPPPILFSAFVFALAAGLAAPPKAWAAAGADSDEISGHLGSSLPNQIEGVTEILPVFGFRYMYPFGGGFGGEVGLENVHAKGVDFTSATFDVRGDVDLGDRMMAVGYGGATFNYYSPVNQSDRIAEWGGNVGGAFMLGVTDNLWLRSDLRLSFNPGSSLYIGFGLAFRLSGT